MSYDPRWLLLGLETSFGEAVPVPTLATGRVDRALRAFLAEVCVTCCACCVAWCRVMVGGRVFVCSRHLHEDCNAHVFLYHLVDRSNDTG